MRARFLFVCMFLFCQLSYANSNLEVAREITIEGALLIINGSAIRYDTDGSPLYVAALYLENPSTNPDFIISSVQRKRGVMIFSKKLSLERAKKVLVEDLIVNLDPDEFSRVSESLAEFMKYAPRSGFGVGDMAHFDYIPNEGTVININNETVGLVPGDQLYKALLLQWIGARPISRVFKSKILGL